MRYIRPSFLIALLTGAAACGGGSSPPPPPPPTGPPPPPPVGASLDLAPGESAVLSAAGSIRAFEIVGASEAREYQVIMMSGSQVEASETPLKMTARATGAGANVVPGRTTYLPTTSISTGRGPRVNLSELERMRLRSGHLVLQARMDAEMRRVSPRVSPKARARAAGAGIRTNATSGSSVPTVGQALTINSGVRPGQLSVDCGTSRPIDSTVRTVGDNFVIVEDDAVAGVLTAQDYAELDAELDAFVAPVDQAYFGEPADLDDNQRVIAYFTKEVNLLTDPGSPLIILGFFWSGDIADPADCPQSNEAEVLWLRAPDPNGDFGRVTTVASVKRIARSLVAHEYQHLLNAEQRNIIGSGDGFAFEDIWLNEAMSHIGEEVSGFFRVGVPTRAGLNFDDVGIGTVERLAFDDFHADNLRNVENYLSAPTEVAALSVGNPAVSFPMRGYGYMFLRWLGDRFGAASPVNLVGGSGEDALFRELATGGPAQLSGVDNVLRAISVVAGENLTWDEVLAEYFAAPAVVGAEASPPAELQYSSWAFSDLYDGMAANSVPGLASGFPLRPTGVSMGTGASSTSNFDLGASTARYFEFSATGPHPDMLVELTAPSGANVPNGARARVIVVRTR